MAGWGRRASTDTKRDAAAVVYSACQAPGISSPRRAHVEPTSSPPADACTALLHVRSLGHCLRTCNYRSITAHPTRPSRDSMMQRASPCAPLPAFSHSSQT
jgi:hypothetical protein